MIPAAHSPGDERDGSATPATASDRKSPRAAGFPVVGLGASAGGIDALRRLLQRMPAAPGIAMVVVLHLDPTKKSLVSELMSKYTQMPVCQVESDSRVELNHIYVLPPGKYLSVVDGELRLIEPTQPRGARMAIDVFLRSLAQDESFSPVAVILSGTGTDGTLGIKAIKAAGGLVIAQDPATTEHQGMPHSAIATGAVDHILPPERIPEVLVRFAQHPYVRDGAATSAEEESPIDLSGVGLNAILSLLRAHAKHDFRSYKEKAIVRRTRRRMCLYHINEYDQYLEYLREHPEEISSLARDLLITVTDFFRDPEAWDELQRLAIAPIVATKTNHSSLRVWTPGCATGEEPYSVAMLLVEELQRSGKRCPLQVFGTDIDKAALEFARIGRYPKSIEADLSADRLKRFFLCEDGDDYYQVNKMLRETVVFAEQNLIADPPFSKLDIICCRNLLIYLKPEVQEKVIALFHFALRDGGVLLLGSAETIGRQTDLFQTLDKRWRIFERIGPTRHDRVEIPLSTSVQPYDNDTPATPPLRRENQLIHVAQQQLLELLAPTAVLIDRNWRIVFICGDVDPYITRTSGLPSDHLLDNVRRGLRTKLRGAVQQALTQRRTMSIAARVQRNSSFHPVGITVRVVHGPENVDDLALVLFQDLNDAADRPAAELRGDDPLAAAAPQGPRPDADIDADAVIRQLEEELAQLKDDLQATIEQSEAANEEFKAANEEVMSVNEELQSTNEELETSKEELQSLNEELSTVNAQLTARVEELETKHADLENLIAVTNTPTVFLDTELGVRWFTPATQQLIRLKPSDRGRPLEDFANDFTDDDLARVARGVLRDLTPVVDEITCHDGRAYQRRVTPYRTAEHRIGGVVITFWDITQRKRDEEALLASSERLRRMVNVEKVGVLMFNDSGTLLDANDAMLRMLDYSRAEVATQQLTWRSLTPPEYVELSEQQLQRLAETGNIGPYEKEYFRKDGSRIWLVCVGASLGDGTLIEYCIDIGDRKRIEESLRRLNEELEERVADRTQDVRQLAAIVEMANDAIFVRDLDGIVTTWNAGAVQLYGYSAQEIIGQSFDRAIPPQYRGEVREMQQRLLRGEQLAPFETWRFRKDGQMVFVSIALSAMTGADGQIVGIASISRDITARKQAEQRLREHDERFRMVVESAPSAIVMVNESGNIVLVNSQAEDSFGYRRDELVGQQVEILVPERFRGNHPMNREMFLRSPSARPMGKGRDLFGRRKDGAEFPIEIGLTPVRIGAEFFVLSTIADITERKQVEQSMRASEDRFRRLVEQLNLVTDVMSAPVTRCSRDLSYLWVSRPYAEWLGRSPESFPGRPIVDILGAEGFEKIRPHIEAVLSGREVRYEEEVHIPKFGLRWVSATYTPTFDATGAPDGWVGVIIDIDERKRAEQSLAHRVAQQAAVAELSQRALIERDLQALMHQAARAVAAVLGTEFSEVLELLPQNRELLLRAGVGWREGVVGQATLESGVASQAGFTLACDSTVLVQDVRTETRFQIGTLLHDHGVASGMSCRIVGPSGRPYGVLGTHTARTRQFTPEDAIFLESVASVLGSVIQRNHFEESLRAKTEEIKATTQQLWQAAKLASVGELAASIAHELNNPLSTVRLRVESILSRTPAGDPRHRALEIVEQESKRMGNLLANLLQFSRRSPEQFSTVDVRQELVQSVELIEQHLGSRRIRVVRELAEDSPPIYADRQKLRQVFLNLLSNASDAMPDGGTLTLRTQPDTMPDGRAAVRIEVVDTGVGIPATNLAKVLDPFFTTKAEGQGTGLGLAICRRVVEEHKGTIQLESEPGLQTTVRIVLPVESTFHFRELNSAVSDI